MFWPSLHTVEECAELAPDLVSRLTLVKMAKHPNFSVRSTAASICLRWAQFASDRIPVDILLSLSKYDEDWYVQAPANAALKSMVRSVPGVLEIFFSRIGSSSEEERAHAADCILDIAKNDPVVLDPDDLALPDASGCTRLPLKCGDWIAFAFLFHRTPAYKDSKDRTPAEPSVFS